MMQKRIKTEYIVIHCAATTAKQDIGAKEINVWHLQRGFLKIGYHFVIRRGGRVETGRELTEVGAHAQGYNSRSVGICLVGGSDANDLSKAEDNFTDEQWQALRKLLGRMKMYYPTAEILGHRDLPNVTKACPSFDVRAWLKENPCTASTADSTSTT